MPSPNTSSSPNPDPVSIPPLPMPTPSELDDLLYFARTGDLDTLRSSITDLCAAHSCTPSTLLASCIDIDAAGAGTGNTLLHYASANNHLPVVRYVLHILHPTSVHGQGVSANLAPTVVDKSAATLVDQRNTAGNTALHWACMNGSLDVVKVLVEAGGADVTVTNERGQDAVFVGEMSAVPEGRECAEWLLKNAKGLDQGVAGVGAGGERTETEVEETPEDVAEEMQSTSLDEKGNGV